MVDVKLGIKLDRIEVCKQLNGASLRSKTWASRTLHQRATLTSIFQRFCRRCDRTVWTSCRHELLGVRRSNIYILWITYARGCTLDWDPLIDSKSHDHTCTSTSKIWLYCRCWSNTDFLFHFQGIWLERLVHLLVEISGRELSIHVKEHAKI